MYQHLRMLERLQLVEQRRPVTSSATSLKTSYAILDGYLNFYFAFVEPYVSRLRTREDAQRHLQHTVLPRLDEFVSKPTWERVCQEYVRRCEPDATEVGSWWGTVQVAPRRSAQREVDVVAVDADGAVIATGSCKWTNAPLDYGEETLLNSLEAFIPNADGVARHYFSHSPGSRSSCAPSPGRNPSACYWSSLTTCTAEVRAMPAST